MIHEVIITTQNENGSIHIAPMGIRHENNRYIISPFKPSATLNNIKQYENAVINHIDDVRIFAGCLTGRKEWPLLSCIKIKNKYLKSALSHLELQLDYFEDDELRPRFYMQAIHSVNHSSFTGFNRAQAAVIELAILVSRLDMLPAEKIRNELKYLTIAIEKTSGENEKIAWQWLMEKVYEFEKQNKQELTA